MAKVSVVIPIYNTEEYLAKCLDSVCCQTLSDIEIICVNDGSTDNSVQILEDFANKDSRIKLLHQENKSAGTARNYGLSKARGEYIIFLDSDDYYYPNMLEKLVEKAQDNDADLTMCKYNIIVANQENRVISNQGFREVFEGVFNRRNIPNIFHFSRVVPWNKLYKTAFVKRHHLQFSETKISNDIAFVVKTFFLAERICQVDEVLLDYIYGNPTSVTSKRGDYIYYTPLSMENIYQFIRSCGDFDQYKNLFIEFLTGDYMYNFGFMASDDVLKKVVENLKNSGHLELITQSLVDKLLYFKIFGCHNDTLYKNLSKIIKLLGLNKMKGHLPRNYISKLIFSKRDEFFANVKTTIYVVFGLKFRKKG